ncbi:MAG: hypothetical protein WCC38_01755 [Pseudonocardiaceae bacterium]
MSDAMHFAELADHYVELLPDRTVLSMLSTGVKTGPGHHAAGGTSFKDVVFPVIFGSSDPFGGSAASSGAS